MYYLGLLARVEDTGGRYFLARLRERTQHGCCCCTFGASRRSAMRRGRTSLLLFLLLLCVDKLTAYASLLLRRWCLCLFLFGFLFLCFFLWLFRFLFVCSLASVLCHCCWRCFFCCCWGYRDFLVVLLMVLWLLWCWQLLVFFTCMKLRHVLLLVSCTVLIDSCFFYNHTAPSPHRVRLLVFFVAPSLLLLLLFLW